MSLYFVNTHSNHPAIARSVDDLHIRGPILLAPYQLNPLVERIEPHNFGPTWRLATIGSEELLQGKRFENAVWRLWGQQVCGVMRVERADEFIPMMPRGRTWREKELLVPVVVSQETFHNKHELFFVKPSLDVGSSLEAPVCSQDVLLLRPCLKRGTSSVYGNDSPLSLRSSLPSSSPTETSPCTRRVLFNACVERCEIAAAPFECTQEDNEGGSMLGLIFSDDQYQDVYSLGDVLYQFQPRLQQSVFEEDSSEDDEEEEEEKEFYPLLPTTLLGRSEAIILPLHPGQIAPLACSESDSNVKFVPPKGMVDLDEEELRPYQSRPLRRRIRILDLSQMLFTEAEEEVEIKLGVETPGGTSVENSDAEEPEEEATRDDWFTDIWLANDRGSLVESEDVESGWCGKEDEVEEVDGDAYYDCREGVEWNDAYDFDEGDDDEGAGSSDGVELVSMMATSLGSFFW